MPENYKSERDAIASTLSDALKDSAPGEKATAQSDSQIDNPHYHSGQSSGEKHIDGYVGEKQSDGSVKIDKIHSDD